MTYLVERLDIPFRVLKELVDVLAEHLFEVSVLHTALASASLGSLDHRSTVSLATIRLSTHSLATFASSLGF